MSVLVLRRPHVRALPPLCLAAAASLLSNGAWAEDYFWGCPQPTGDWSTVACWSPNALPGGDPSDTAVLAVLFAPNPVTVSAIQQTVQLRELGIAALPAQPFTLLQTGGSFTVSQGVSVTSVPAFGAPSPPGQAVMGSYIQQGGANTFGSLTVGDDRGTGRYVMQGGELQVHQAISLVRGALDLQGGSTLAGAITVSPTATLTASGSTLSGTLNNHGQVTMSDTTAQLSALSSDSALTLRDATLRVGGDFDNSKLTQASGRIEVAGAGGLRNWGQIDLNGDLTLAATQSVNWKAVTVGAGHTFTLEGSGTFLQRGQLVLDGGTLGTGDGLFRNEVGAELLGPGQITGRYANQGTIKVDHGTLAFVNPLNSAYGSSGRFVVGPGAKMALSGYQVVNGTFDIAANGEVSVDDQLFGAFVVQGGGHFQLNGRLSVNDGVTQVATAATLGPRSNLNLVLGSSFLHPDCRTCASKIAFSGPLTLEGGELSFGEFTGHLAFQAGDTFDVLDWLGPVQGQFGYIQLPTLTTGLQWDTTNLYTTGALRVLATPVPEPSTAWLAWVGALLAGLRLRPRLRAR